MIRHRHGDIKKLREIRDTIRHDNFITTDDKSYVESLISTHLKNQPLDKALSRQRPTTKPTPKIKLESKSTTVDSNSKSSFAFSFSSNKNLGILAGVAAAIAIIVIVGFTGMNIPIDSTVSSTTSKPLLVNVDQVTYQRADIISISGDTISYTDSVELSIENANGVKIWNENINPKNDGQFSTLVIAGGGGWENNGVYTLTAEQANGETTAEIEFKIVA